jgi:hypothetical protein
MSYEQLLQLEDHIGYVNRGLSNEQVKAIQKVPYKEVVLKRNGEQQQEHNDMLRILMKIIY